MEQLKFPEEIDVWEHPPYSGIVLNEERKKKFEENLTDSLLQLLFKMTQHGTMRRSKMITGLLREIIYRDHVEPRVKLYVPREESFPIPLKYIDVARNTYTSQDTLFE